MFDDETISWNHLIACEMDTYQTIQSIYEPWLTTEEMRKSHECFDCQDKNIEKCRFLIVQEKAKDLLIPVNDVILIRSVQDEEYWCDVDVLEMMSETQIPKTVSELNCLAFTNRQQLMVLQS